MIERTPENYIAVKESLGFDMVVDLPQKIAALPETVARDDVAFFIPVKRRELAN
jgi:hypothetical protein